MKTPRALELESSLNETLHAFQLTFSKPIFDPKTANGIFKISTMDYSEAVLLSKLSKSLETSAPLIELEVSHRGMYSVADLQSGLVDMSIGIMPSGSTEGCVFRKLFEDRYVCAMCIDHPLANQELTLENFSAYPHSINMSLKNEAAPVDDDIMKLKIKRKVIRSSCHFFASLYALENTNLLHNAVRLNLDFFIKEKKLIYKELPFETKPIEVYLMWHIKNNEDPSHKWFREQVFKAAETLRNYQASNL